MPGRQAWVKEKKMFCCNTLFDLIPIGSMLITQNSFNKFNKFCIYHCGFYSVDNSSQMVCHTADTPKGCFSPTDGYKNLVKDYCVSDLEDRQGLTVQDIQ